MKNQKKMKKDQKWLTLRKTVKTQKKVSFRRESDSKQEKPKENLKKQWESNEKSLKHRTLSKNA